MENTKSIPVSVGNLTIGGGNPIVVQTMCNTHTFDVEGTVNQCVRMADAGAGIIRITVPGLKDVDNIRAIREDLLGKGINVPIVADIHFSSETAISVAPYVDKVRINPGNFQHDHDKAREQFARLINVCRESGTAIRIGLNHGSLGAYITDRYGNTPEAMAIAAMEWIRMCVENDFRSVVVSLKASNTIVMTQAYRNLHSMMKEEGVCFPLHVGVTEAGNGDSGRIKSCVGISALLSDGIGDTVRVSLTEDPVNEIPVGQYLADRYHPDPEKRLRSSLVSVNIEGKKAIATYAAPSRERLVCDLACDFGKSLLNRDIDEVEIHGSFGGESISEEFGKYLSDELLQACRRRFYKPEYIACPGCGRTMYDLQKAFEEVKSRTSCFKDIVIAVMGCIVNGPGEMADADYGYVGEGGGRVSIYRGKEAVLRHVNENEAVDRLVELIRSDRAL